VDTAATPQVTVSIPTHNRSELLGRCLESVITQSLADIEIFISDNASTDDTAEVVASFKDPRVHYERLGSNIGLAGNVTRCLRLGSAPLVALLADDEVFLPDALARKVALLKRHPQVDVVHSALRLIQIGPDNQPLGETVSYAGGREDTIEPGAVVVRRLLTEAFFMHATPVLARRLVVSDDQWDATDGPACDLGFCLRISQRSRAVAYIAEPLGASLVHPQAASIEQIYEFESGAWQPTFAALANVKHVQTRFLTEHGREISELRTLRAANRRHTRKAVLYLLKSKLRPDRPFRARLRTLLRAARVDPFLPLSHKGTRYLAEGLLGKSGLRFARRIRRPFRRSPRRSHESKRERESPITSGPSTHAVRNQLPGMSASSLREPMTRTEPSSRVRVLSFYLPQFHPIPENDEWWGRGFTEWRTVSRARPLFRGHDQPHVPADLGFYDLRDPDARDAQATLARDYGIHGFCYYHYWFNGRRLLGRPLDEVLATGRPDFPFCLCWANEDWTRVWDGRSGEILIRHEYSEEDDRRHIQWLGTVMRDDRYIRIGDRPLLLVYRATLLPDPLRTTNLWREEAERMGLGELFLCRVESFASEHGDPTSLGFDASIEFQPDWTQLGRPLHRGMFWSALRTLRLSSRAYQTHRIHDYGSVLRRMLEKSEPAYRRFPCVTPSWDNTPRREVDAVILKNSTPELYAEWLGAIVRKAAVAPPEEALVFVNAWNEWGEGSHLEPSQRWGRAYLEATLEALAARPEALERVLAANPGLP
jgi:hypothetical protein